LANPVMPLSTRVMLLCWTSGFALLGLVAGLVVGARTDWIPQWPGRGPLRADPLPYHVPKYPGGVSLRLAMVHDVLHERFLRQRPAHYAARTRRVRLRLKEMGASQEGGKRPDGYFALLDDLGAGLEHLGEHDEAVRVLRDKLKQQQAQGLKGRALYTSYANL